MASREIAIANAESSITRWTVYTNAARAANDAKRIAYGEVRISRARRRLAALRRP